MSIPIVMYRERYLPVSETFIYQQLTHFKNFRPYVLCGSVLEDGKNLFPYPRIYPWFKVRRKHRQVRQKNIQLIYARFGMGGVKMLRLKTRTGLPMITSFHGSDVSKHVQKNTSYFRMLPKLFRVGEKFTVVCEYMKQRLMELGCPEYKIVVIKSGIDLGRFTYQPKLELTDEIRLLSVGRLTEKKGMRFLLEALSILRSMFPGIRLVIVGDGEQRELLLQRMSELKLEEAVEWKGQRSNEEVHQELKRCDLFVNASCTAEDGNEEGIPNVLIEAMATGRIVVATQHAGIPELVEHGKTGYLVPPKDSCRLAEMIEYAIRNRTEWGQFLDLARKKVEEEHDICKQMVKLEQLMSELLK